MKLILGHDAYVADWVAGHIPQVDDFGPCTAIGVGVCGVLLGACVYHDYQPRFRSIQMSFASINRRWLIGPPGDRKATIRALMAYPFEQLAVGRVTALTPRRNRAARRFIDRFGFKREGVARQGFGDDDMVISGLLASEWRASAWAPPSGAKR